VTNFVSARKALSLSGAAVLMDSIVQSQEEKDRDLSDAGCRIGNKIFDEILSALWQTFQPLSSGQEIEM
jgi:hypothetical protein